MMLLAGKSPLSGLRRRNQPNNPQNNALHLWLEMVAKCLNDAGLDMRHTIREDVDMPWTQSLKEYLWRPLQK